MLDSDAIRQLRQAHPNHSVHQSEVSGLPIWMFYTIYAGDDPSAPHPYIEDHMLFTTEGISADWVPDAEVRRMEDEVFAARGKRCR